MMNLEDIKVELIKYPSNDDLMLMKTCALNTVGKKAINLPIDEWIIKMIESEHSPIRELKFVFKITMPYCNSVHFVRHKFGVEHYVQSQREDRTNVKREERKQIDLVSHIISMDAQALINMSHKRLCNQADFTTRLVMNMMVKEINKKVSYMKTMLVPQCEYTHCCREVFPCPKGKKYNEFLEEWRKKQ